MACTSRDAVPTARAIRPSRAFSPFAPFAPFASFREVRRHFGPVDPIARTIFRVARLRIGELLVEAKVISPAQLEEALRSPRVEGQKIGQVLVDLGLITETQLTQTLSLQLSVPWVSLYHIDFSRQLLNMVPRELAERFSLVPIFVRHVKKQGNSLYVAMDDPTNEAALAEVARAAGLPVKPMIACLSDIRSAIRVYYAEASESHVRAQSNAPPPRERVLPVPPAPPPPPRAAHAAHTGPVAAQAGPPPPPVTGRPPLPTVVDSAELVAERLRAEMETSPPSEDSPDAAPELEVSEYVPKSRPPMRPRMVSLTLLDGTTLDLPGRTSSLPSPPANSADAPPPSTPAPTTKRDPRPHTPIHIGEHLTARDLVSALRAVAHGADATEVLGNTDWQAMFAALLSLMLKKNLIADWEFVEELRNI
jgi:type IV pilus assembly protein PilB